MYQNRLHDVQQIIFKANQIYFTAWNIYKYKCCNSQCMCNYYDATLDHNDVFQQHLKIQFPERGESIPCFWTGVHYVNGYQWRIWIIIDTPHPACRKRWHLDWIVVSIYSC